MPWASVFAAVFHIVNEQTRRGLKIGRESSFGQGGVVGLANHTVLIGENERKYRLIDSAAPDSNARRNRCLGSILVFRDFTERKNAD